MAQQPPKHGTRITYRGGPKNPAKDNRAALKNVPSGPPMTDKEYRTWMRDPTMCFIQVSDETVYGIDKLWYKRFPFLLLEPNPVTIYFSVAFDITRQLAEARAQMDELLKVEEDPHEKSRKLSVAFTYVFKVMTVGISFSYLALEAFLNQQLPKFGSIRHKGKGVSRERVERYFTFDQKLDEVIPQLAGKDFALAHPRKREAIRQLKKLRHDITHLKQREGSGFTRYEAFFQEIMNTDLKRIVGAVKACINFYYPRLIVNYRYSATPSAVRKKKSEAVDSNGPA